MSTLAADTAPAASSSRLTWLERYSPLGSLGLIVMIVGGFSAGTGNTTDLAKVQSFLNKTHHPNLSYLIGLIGLILLSWFVWGTSARLARVGQWGMSSLAGRAGQAGAALYMIAVCLWAGPLVDNASKLPPAAYDSFENAGWAIGSAGGALLGIFAVAAALGAQRAGLIGRKRQVAGVVVGVLAFASLMFYPQALLALWLLVVGASQLIGNHRLDKAA